MNCLKRERDIDPETTKEHKFIYKSKKVRPHIWIKRRLSKREKAVQGGGNRWGGQGRGGGVSEARGVGGRGGKRVGCLKAETVVTGGGGCWELALERGSERVGEGGGPE